MPPIQGAKLQDACFSPWQHGLNFLKKTLTFNNTEANDIPANTIISQSFDSHLLQLKVINNNYLNSIITRKPFCIR